jgi:hypothetical protein
MAITNEQTTQRGRRRIFIANPRACGESHAMLKQDTGDDLAVRAYAAF